jgi:Flp pilus assembly protein protease CpaA
MWLLVGAGGVPSISSLMASALSSSFERGAVLAVLFSGGPLSLILLFLLGLPLYLFKIIGGGDYKLLLAMSLATPLEMIPDFLIWVLIWNSVLSLMMILTQGVVWKSILFLAPASLARSLALPGTEHRGVGIPFSIGISLGYLSLLQSAVLGFSLVKIF